MRILPAILLLLLATPTVVSQTEFPADVYTSKEFLNQIAQDKIYLFLSSKTAESLLVQKSDPQYQIKGMQALVTGTVVIAFEITSEGAVRHAMVISGPKMLQASVLEAVRRRRYKPFLLNGKPTAVATSVSIQVTINDRGVTFRDTPQK
jgi:TonB family protein